MVRTLNWTIVILTAAVTLIVCEPTVAQRRTFSSPDTAAQLIALDQVHRELKLNPEQKKQVKKLIDNLESEISALSGGLSRDERREKQEELSQNTDKLRNAAEAPINALLDDGQRKRLGQIVLWVRGSSALGDDKLAKQLKLTEKQQSQIQKVNETSRGKLSEYMRGLRDGTQRASNFRTRVAQFRKAADEGRLAVLGDDQKANYLKLKGTKFELVRAAGSSRSRRPRVETATTRRIQKRTYAFKEASKDMEYALFVPTTYSATKASPLIVALHGLGSNPQGIMRYPRLTELAEKHGYIVVAPMGYNERGWYGSRGQSSRRDDPNNLGELSEKDVMNVLALVRKEFKIADKRVYLMGHSMGGGGTWHLGIKHSQIWAALAPIAPAIRGNTDDLAKIKHIPVIVVQGDEDRLVPVRGARRWVAKMKELKMEHVYIEVAGGDHVTVAFRNLPQIFEFFNKHSKKE